MIAARDVWDALGGRGEPPGLLGAFSGRLLVISSARCLWEDLQYGDPDGFDARWPGDRMAVNYAIHHYPGRVRHAVSLHVEGLAHAVDFRRRAHQGAGDITAHSVSRGPADRLPDDFVCWDLDNAGGTSGLLAALIGRLLGYDEIVLAGVPLDDTGHFYDPPGVGTRYADPAVALTWRTTIPSLGGRVTSLSGRTREWLGAPAEAA